MPPKGTKRPRKRSSDAATGPPPITFVSPGLQLDARLLVFDQEYHVHSLILKLHSAYFRRYLHSAEKDGEAAYAAAQFKYDYVSVIDEDGVWGLEPADKAAPPTEAMIARISQPDSEKEAFRKLLCAMYNRPYRIEDVAELETVTRLADFYCALPIVSGTLSGALLGSPMLKRDPDPENQSYNDFARKAGRLIFVAKKLRHVVLFRECFIHLAGNLQDEEYLGDAILRLKGDKELWLLLTEGYARMCQLLLKAHQAFVISTVQSYWSPQQPLPKLRDEGPEESSVFFKALKEQLQGQLSRGVDDMHLRSLYVAVDRLMRSNLTLDQTGFQAGEGPYKWCFLCADISDEEMPWDLNELDW
ncbi:uncharacterized protein PAC_13308 [Phialocephala subalpina]|uniref:BTB domain-containing protein n=1 Tax=Phialocephala subalpina TaxID=576137 RepID=A0A1L7XEF9_9HELO|nr:uncharacterized protein PAC_13308 [Phialocephala subalpina]